MREIKLTQGKVALVDDKDFERANQFKWHAYQSRPQPVYYAQRNLIRSRDGHKGKTESLHRFILNAPIGFLVDHINGNGLDCRRENLRLCANAENSRNCRSHRDSKSRYKGVSFWDGKWRAQIWMNGKKTHVGNGFNDEITAARAYDKKARELFGEFARLNFQD